MRNTVHDECVRLSQKGDWVSLDRIIGIYLSLSDSKTKKKVRQILKKTTNRNSVVSVILNAINKAKTEEIRLDLLFTGQLIERERFLYDYLAQQIVVNGKIKRNVFPDLVSVSRFTTKEQDILSRFIVENETSRSVVFKYLDHSHKQQFVDSVKQDLKKGILSTSTLRVLNRYDSFISELQEDLKEYASSYPEKKQHMLFSIRVSTVEDSVFFEDLSNLFITYNILSRISGDISLITTDNTNVQISKSIILNQDISEEQWKYIKERITEETAITPDLDKLDHSFYLFLRGLYKIDPVWCEKLYISLYDRTGLYSNRVLHEMTELEIPYAYRVLTNRLLTVKNKEIQRKTIEKLLKHYSSHINDTFEHIKQLNDDTLILYAEELASKYNLTPNSLDQPLIGFSSIQSFQLIDRSVVISDLLTKIAKEINANTFFSAVGFAYSSGLAMLSSVFDEVSNNHGQSELIVGSLQTYGSQEKNTKIDKKTAEHLNSLINNQHLCLFTYHNCFYHGKYYYLANDSTAYIILGSSNISKTAFLSNYELDSMFKVARGSVEDNKFIEWYRRFRFDCDQIDYLDADCFDNYAWDAEQRAYGGRNYVHVSQIEITSRIDSLTDAETKNRLKMWISHNPTEILSNLEIVALDGYIAFLYSDNELAVFESFTPGNAFYSFKYDDFDVLLSQLSQLTKSEMLVASSFLMRGYHIHDQERLENKVNKLLKGSEMY